MITWQRPTKDEDGNLNKNLKVWRTVDDNAGQEGERSVVGQFTQRSQTGWNLQYNADEKYCARVVTNEVQFYESGDLKTVWNKLRVEGVTDFALAPGKNPSVAVFIPERKVCNFSFTSSIPILTTFAGPTSHRQGLQRAPIRVPSLAEDILQGR
jgi:translation initiation factor 2A